MRREVVIWALVALLAYALYRVLAPFWTTVAWAAILATLLNPLYELLERWIPSRRWRALLVSAFAAIVIFGPLLLFLVLGALEVVQEVNDVQERLRQAGTGPIDLLPAGLVATLESWTARLGEVEILQGVFDETSLRDLIRTGIDRALQGTLNFSSFLITDLLSLSLIVAMTWIALFYLLEDGPRLLDVGYDLLPFEEGTERDFVARLREMLFSVMYSNLAVALLQGTLGGIGFAIVGINNPVLWGAVMAPLALVPIFGTGLVWVPASVILGLQGAWPGAIFLVVWGSSIVALSDNFIRPMVLSGRTSLHPLLVFLGLLGGVQAFGVLGLFLGPVTLAVLVTILDFYRAGDTPGLEQPGG